MYICMHVGASARMRVHMCEDAYAHTSGDEDGTQCIYTEQCLVGALALLIWKAVTKEIRTTGTAEDLFDEPDELRTC